MKTSSTKNFGLTRINVLLFIAAACLLSGCETTNTTVSDGFGMDFTETTGKQADRVKID